MKKFLLLFVGVLFALSANAKSWTFYVDIANTKWSTAPYVYFGNGATEQAYGDATYYSKFQGELVDGTTTIYKFESTSGWDELTSIFFSVKDFDLGSGKAQGSFTFDGQTTYGVFNTFQKHDRNWKAYNNALYILAPKGTNAATFDTRYITLEETTIELRGGFDGWGSGISLTKQPDLTYFANSGKQITTEHELKFVIGGTWTGYSGTVTPGEPFFLDGGDNFKLDSQVSNAQITYDPILGGRIKIYEGPKVFVLRGDFSSIGGGNNWTKDNYTFTNVSEGTYTFDLSAQGVSTLTTGVQFKIYSGGKWYRPSDNMKAGVEYTITEMDGNIQVAEDITDPVFKLVVDGETLKLTVSSNTPSTPTNYTIYFDAVRSGWENLSVSGVDATIVDDAKTLKKITYSAVEGTEITLSNGTDSYPVTPSNDHVYYFDSSLKDGGLYANYTYTPPTPPTPAVVTSYTIYFDTLQSGWRNVALFNDGVEVVGSLHYTNFIRGGNSNNVYGYLHKYTVNTTDAKKLTFTNGTNSYSLKTITDGNVYYVSGSELAGAALDSYKVNANPSYRLHGTILGNDSWGTYKMVYYDGLWIYELGESENFVAGKSFGIKALGPNDGVSDSNPWIYSESSSNNEVKVGQTTKAIKEIKEGDNKTTGANFYSNVKGKYTLVFDPANMTIMFINPAVAATATAEPVAGDGVNTLKVSFATASYYSGEATDFILSNGTFSAGAKVSDGTVSFENVPWSANYTLTPQDGAAIPAAIPVTISAPTITNAEYNEDRREWFLVPSENDLSQGMLSLQVTTTGSLYYYLPQAICKVDGQVVASNAFWSKNGFTIQIPAFCELDNGELPADFSKAVEITYTPVFPFAVGNASTYGLRAYSGDVQTVLGIASTATKTITNVNQEVSGIEGVVIEAEDAPVEYFNLQGQRVNGDLAPGIYIRRQGATVTKVRI